MSDSGSRTDFSPVDGRLSIAAESLSTLTWLTSVNFHLIQLTSGQLLVVPLLENVA